MLHSTKPIEFKIKKYTSNLYYFDKRSTFVEHFVKLYHHSKSKLEPSIFQVYFKYTLSVLFLRSIYTLSILLYFNNCTLKVYFHYILQINYDLFLVFICLSGLEFESVFRLQTDIGSSQWGLTFNHQVPINLWYSLDIHACFSQKPLFSGWSKMMASYSRGGWIKNL